MVLRKNLKIKYALISVYNKSKLNTLCKSLEKYNYKFISTGTTCKKIKSLGFRCLEISEITKFKEILDGRVKTLNPKIFGSILYKRNNYEHLKEFKNLRIPSIDLVIVNLYPFKKYSKNKDNNKVVEMIDIGGPSLVRAAAKNFEYVTTICDIKYYPKLIINLNKNEGNTDIIFRKEMALKTFQETSEYDNSINEWFLNKKKSNKKIKLRYGENPKQDAFILKNNKKTIFDYQISGKQISYNNIIDIDNGIKCINEFTEPTCVIIKHNNPCGVASASKIDISFRKAFDADSKSAFGGIVFLNRKVSKKLAYSLSKIFLEVIVANEYEPDAIKILTQKKKLILFKINNLRIPKMEFKSTLFGTIHQSISREKINKKFFKLVAHKPVTKKLLDDLVFSAKVVKHLKSNAIVLTKNKQTIGLGCGQTNRVDSLNIAIKRNIKNFKSNNFVCVSDGFFPFTDSLKLLNNNGCNVIAQPYGSINDEKNIKYAVKNKLSLYFLKHRLFKH
ncbi:bifunctional phosphoribosylaminoimidazolecarboxamide formyltransferase/IMP cyclohydrolase [Pelagibacteraceae bacterium]|nr:bifunctional phosphoribosylaminoimidazolecarboxamide formyltransferase/IMP cyclohydrolase [Pelagibacteraceae bacterium]